MSRDLRKYARQTRARSVLGLVLLAFLVGGGLIYIFYGQGPALMGVSCLLGALVPTGIVWLILVVLDWIAKRADRD